MAREPRNLTRYHWIYIGPNHWAVRSWLSSPQRWKWVIYRDPGVGPITQLTMTHVTHDPYGQWSFPLRMEQGGCVQRSWHGGTGQASWS